MNIPCPPKETLKRYLQAELPAEEASNLESHVSSCPACQLLMNQLADSGVSLPIHLLANNSESNNDLSKTADFVPETQRSPSAESSFDVAGYNFLEPIAEGGMGAVYRVRDLDLRRELAVKILREDLHDHPTSHERFLEEAHITGQLQHPGIVPIHELGELPDGRPFFSMKLVKGQTLAELLAERSSPAQDLPRHIQVFQQICQTLAYAHSRGVIHRDLKPNNIMVGAFGEVQVMDWGLAKRIKGPENGTTEEQPTKPTVGEPWDPPAAHQHHPQTEPGAVMGTWAYMPPEQARGQVDLLDERCDVFSLGAILCEILTGKPTYTGTNKEEVKTQAKQADMTRVHERLDGCKCDRELIDLAQRCLSAKQEDRPADAGELAEAVTAYQTAVQEKLRRAELDKAKAQVRRRWVTVAAAALVLLIAGAAGGALWYWQVEAARAIERNERNAEHSRRLDSIKDALKETHQLRHKLRADIAKIGGVTTMLNAPEDWEGRLAAIRSELQRGKKLFNETKQQIPSELCEEIKAVDKLLERDEDERKLALELERVRLDNATLVKGKYDYTSAAKEYPTVFANSGLDLNRLTPKQVAQFIENFAIKEHLIAALDEWAQTAFAAKKLEYSQRVLRVAREADPNPWRNQLRDVAVWRDDRALYELTNNILRNRTSFARLSPNMLASVGGLLLANKERAVAWLRAAQIQYPADFWINFELANALNEKNLGEAAGFYRAALARRSSAAVAWNNLGVVLAKMKEFNKAIDVFKKAVENESRYALAYFNMGVTLRESEDLESAEKAFRKAIEIKPKYSQAFTELGVLLGKTNDLKGAIACYNKAIEIDPEDVLAWNNLGAALHLLQNYDGAVNAYRKSLTIGGEVASTWSNLGLALTKLKKFTEAAEAFANSLKIDNRSARNWEYLASVLDDQGKTGEAAAAYAKSLKINDNDAIVWNNYGFTLYRNNRLEAAVSAYEKAVAIDDKMVAAWNNLANAFVRLNRLADAVVAGKRSLEIDEKQFLAWHNLGSALRDQRKLDEAVAAYKKALQLDEKRGKTWRNLGIAYHLQKRIPEACAAFKKSLAIDNDSEITWTDLANAYYDTKDLPAAIDAYKKALLINPQNSLAHADLGLAMRDYGKFKEAVISLERALKWLRAGHPARSAMMRDHVECQRLLQREQRLAPVLKGEKTSAAEQLQMAGLCQRYLRRYRNAAKLYTDAFAAEPTRADDSAKQFRYNAARAAALAAAGKGKDAGKLGSEEKTELRRQTLDWLRADLSGYWKLVEAKPQAAAVMVVERMAHWQKDADLAAVRDAKPRAAMAEAERKQWQQLWSDVETLRKKARGSYYETILKGNLTNAKLEQTHEVKLTAGKTCIIDMQSKQFDTFLRLHDAKGNKLAENDDIVAGTSPAARLNSRLTFTPKHDGAYRLIATSFQQKGRGAYELIIREFKRAAGNAPAG